VTILVSGSSGLIGTALLRDLADRGQRVVRLVRPGSTGRTPGTPSPAATSVVEWDPARGTIDFPALESAGPYEGVVHLAGAGVGDKRWSEGRRGVILRSRVDSTNLLVANLVQLSPKPPVLVSASAIGYYGDRGDEELTEPSAQGDGFLAGVVEAWEASTRPASDAGLRVVLLRTGLVLSADGGVLGRLAPLFRLGLGGKLGPGTQYMSWISLEDQVGVIIRALTDGRLAGPVNAVAPNPVTNAQFTVALGQILHRPARLAVPSAVLRLGLGRAMADEMLLASQRVVATVLTEVGFPFRHSDLKGTLTDLVG